MYYLKADFEQAIAAEMANHPAAYAALQAGDPRLLAQIGAAAAMLAMFSVQLSVAEVEPFMKARDATVMADASLKGILPLARPAKMRLSVVNTGTAAVTLAVGRAIVDPRGRRYTVDAAATVAAGAGVGSTPAASITVTQITTRVITHTVTATAPFYAIDVAPSDDGLGIVGISVSSNTGSFAYTQDFVNVNVGDRVYHVETDEQRRLWIRFGATDSTGYQPANGEAFTVTVTECEGLIDPLSVGEEFSLEYVNTTDEAKIKLSLAESLSRGANAPDIETLRILARYPALHTSDAVYLSDFDFIIRRKLSGLTFLAVWNEQVEEAARGANILNINKLFVSFELPTQLPATTETQIRDIIARADNSLKVAFVARRVVEVPITVTAQVASVHDAAAVGAQIKAAILEEYGAGSVAASEGFRNFRYQDVHRMLRAKIPALQDLASDFTVTIGATPSPLPEDHKMATTGSVTVSVSRAAGPTGLWNA